jgi:hypothetical protein
MFCFCSCCCSPFHYIFIAVMKHNIKQKIGIQCNCKSCLWLIINTNSHVPRTDHKGSVRVATGSHDAIQSHTHLMGTTQLRPSCSHVRIHSLLHSAAVLQYTLREARPSVIIFSFPQCSSTHNVGPVRLFSFSHSLNAPARAAASRRRRHPPTRPMKIKREKRETLARGKRRAAHQSINRALTSSLP